MNANINRLVQRISTVRFEFPSTLVVFHSDINRSVGSERKDVPDIDVPEDPRSSLKHLIWREQLHYWPEGLGYYTHHINESCSGDYRLPVDDMLSQVGE